jgi:hypothetical protein
MHGTTRSEGSEVDGDKSGAVAAMKWRFVRARKRGELPKDINVKDYTRYLSPILAGLSIRAASGSTKAELKRTAEMAFRFLGY